MMKGDFSRRTFRRDHHYSQVLMQQGRVQLDADWNEQVDIARHLQQRTAVDTIGSHGGPRHEAGLAVTCPVTESGAGCPGDQIVVTAGRYYVEGVLCENEQNVPLAQQPDLPGIELPSAIGKYIAYLDVWLEHVSAVEQPGLLEVALQGPDTTTRARTVWQVQLTDAGAVTGCDELDGWTPPHPQTTGRMRARAQSTQQDPCAAMVPVTAGYRRLENQLYRVEIHDSSDGQGAGATFVWSRENGSVVARLDTLEGDVVTVTAPGRDDRLGFVKDCWVEVLPRERELHGEPGYLARLDTPDGVRLPVAEWLNGSAPKDVGEDAVVRRWESKAAAAVPDTDKWLELEDGVQVAFEAGGVLHTGDYWLVPARTANLRTEAAPVDQAGDVEWDRLLNGDPLFRPPDGITHHYAPIALLERHEDGTWRATDCRRLFAPLIELGARPRSLSLVGGDGQEAMPGDPLPQPLQVLVSSDGEPEPGATVQFIAAAGMVAPDLAQLSTAAGATLDVPTDGEGIARCAWMLAADPSQPNQTVTAQLINNSLTPTGAPIHFSGRLSIAEQIWYDAGDCAAMTGVHTVQAALDRLTTIRSLLLGAGAGQVGPPGTDLSRAVEVIVRTTCGPVANALVRCVVAAGAVAATIDELAGGSASVDLVSDPDGVVRCFWRLGDVEGVQPLILSLVGDGAPGEPPTELTVTATAGVGPTGQPTAPGVALLGQNPGLSGRAKLVTPAELATGLAVPLNGAPAPAVDDDPPPLRLTVELPFPLSTADVDLWGPEPVGTTPIVLSGGVRIREVDGDQTVVWQPTRTSQDFLEHALSLLHERQAVDRMKCSLELSDLLLSATSGAPVFTSDRTFAFWLADNDLMVVPTRAGVFRMKSTRSAIQLALSREQLRQRLPEGVSAGPEAPILDLGVARTAADRAFDNQPERRIVLLTEERFRAAGDLVKETLEQLEVTVEVVVVDDLMTAVRERTEARQPLDGVLTDRAESQAVEALSGFIPAVAL